MDEKNIPAQIQQNSVSEKMFADLVADLRESQKRCKYLEQLIEINNISTLDVMVEEYLAASKEFNKRITLELILCEHEAKKREKVSLLINYFTNLSKEFEKLL